MKINKGEEKGEGKYSPKGRSWGGGKIKGLKIGFTMKMMIIFETFERFWLPNYLHKVRETFQNGRKRRWLGNTSMRMWNLVMEMTFAMKSVRLQLFPAAKLQPKMVN